MRKLACITLSPASGGSMPASQGSGLSLKRMSVVTSAPSALL
jgi:C4-dicarboxylate transporter